MELDAQGRPKPVAHDEYCWVFALLKSGAGQIEDSNAFGFEVDLRYRDIPLLALRDMIDQEFYILSEAHHQRYIQTPDMFAGANSAEGGA